MKAFIFVVIFGLLGIFVQGLTEEQRAKVQSYYVECASSTGVAPEAVHHVQEKKLVNGTKVDEFLFCLFKKAGFMNEAGELQLDVVKMKLAGDLSDDDLKAVLNKCKNVTGKDLPEKAGNIYKCYFEATPAHVSLTV